MIKEPEMNAKKKRYPKVLCIEADDFPTLSFKINDKIVEMESEAWQFIPPIQFSTSENIHKGRCSTAIDTYIKFYAILTFMPKNEIILPQDG